MAGLLGEGCPSARDEARLFPTHGGVKLSLNHRRRPSVLMIRRSQPLDRALGWCGSSLPSPITSSPITSHLLKGPLPSKPAKSLHEGRPFQDHHILATASLPAFRPDRLRKRKSRVLHHFVQLIPPIGNRTKRAIRIVECSIDRRHHGGT